MVFHPLIFSDLISREVFSSLILGHLSALVHPGSVWGQRPLLLRDSHLDLPHAGLAASMDFGWLLAGLTGTALRGATALSWYDKLPVVAQGDKLDCLISIWERKFVTLTLPFLYKSS